MSFLTFGLPVLSPVLLEERDSDQAAVWVLVCWLGTTHHTIQDKPTLAESPQTATNVDAWARLVS